MIHDLKLRLEAASGACMLFDSAALLHSTEECALSGPGQAARMGVQLYCDKDVRGLALYSCAVFLSPARLRLNYMTAPDLQWGLRSLTISA